MGLGCGLSEVAERGASCFGRGALRNEGGGGGVGDGGGAPCWALLPPGLGRLRPNVIEDVFGESGSRCRAWAWAWVWLRVHELPADRVWYLVLIQAYLEQGTAKGDSACCQGVVVMNGLKARADNKWAVYRGVKEIRVDERVRKYDILLHTLYCHYPREVVRIPEPKDGRMVVYSDGSVVEGQPRKAGAAAVQVKGVGQEKEVIVHKVVYGAAFHREVNGS